MSSHSKWKRERKRLAQLAASQQPIPNILRQPGVMHQQVQTTFFSGPLPAPEQLEHYERVQAGLADRIVVMAEKQYAMAESQTAHRQTLERRIVTNNIVLQYLGWASATSLGIGGLASAIWLIAKGKEIGGAAAFIGSLATLVGLFVYGRHKQTDDLNKKRPPK